MRRTALLLLAGAVACARGRVDLDSSARPVGSQSQVGALALALRAEAAESPERPLLADTARFGELLGILAQDLPALARALEPDVRLALPSERAACGAGADDRCLVARLLSADLSRDDSSTMRVSVGRMSGICGSSTTTTYRLGKRDGAWVLHGVVSRVHGDCMPIIKDPPAT